MLSILRWALLTVGFMLLGDRAMLRRGGPGATARAFGMRVPKYVPHPYMLYTLNRDWVAADGLSRHNRLEFRGGEIGRTKPTGTLRVVCMGESSTYGSGIRADEDTYPGRLQLHLARRFPGRTIEVVNAAVEGFTTAENVLRALFDVVPLGPDLVIYYYTHNDVHARRYPQISRDYREYSRSWFEPHGNGGIVGRLRRALSLARGDIGELVRRTEASDGNRPAANVANNPPDAFEANLRAIAALLRAHGARLLFVNPNYRGLDGDGGFATSPVEPENLAFRAVWEHRRIVASIAHELEEGYLDLYGRLPYSSKREDFPIECYLDFVHFSAAGADRTASLVCDVIVEQRLLSVPPAADQNHSVDL